MNILITGGSGYIGGRLTQYLSNKNYNIFIGTRKSEGLIDCFPKLNIKKIDWNCKKSILNSLNEIDIVIHLASLNAQECEENDNLAYKVNVGNTQSLFECVLKKNIKKFLYFSTIHVYGSPLLGTLKESQILEPAHPYAKTHYEAEDVIKKLNSKNQVSNIIVRLSNAFGAPINSKNKCWHLVFNDFIKQAVNTNKIIINSKKNVFRDFIAIEDVCRAVDYLIKLDDKSDSNAVYNLGQGQSLSIYQIAEVIKKRFEMHNRLIRIEYDFNLEQINDNFNFDIKKIINSGFNFKQKFNYNNEIDRLIKFCIKNN